MRTDHKHSACDPQLLRGFLERDLTAREEAVLESHLDGCDACRRRISDSAAEPDWWADAHRYLKPDGWDAETGNSAAATACFAEAPGGT